MQCPPCQAENRAGRRFCAECGAPLAMPCSACGFSNEPEEKFCDGCGTALTAAPRPPEPMDVYELVGVTTFRRRWQVAAARGLTRFVGRPTERTL